MNTQTNVHLGHYCMTVAYQLRAKMAGRLREGCREYDFGKREV